MALENKWVTYLDRSYRSIKTAVLNRMKVLVPEMTDLSESNLFVIIVSLFAGLIEQINYYLDNIAREVYITTARRYSSLIKITRLIDYNVMAKVSSKTDILITAVDSNGDPVTLTNNYTFDAGLVVKDESGIEFITISKVTMLANTSSVIVGARQSKQVSDENIGVTDTSPSQQFQLADNYEHGSLQIEVASETWELKDTLAYSGPLDKHFIVRVNESKEAWLEFGDGVNGEIPPNGQNVLATYYETLGLGGRMDAGTIIVWDSVPTPPVQVPVINNFTVTNPIPAAGGTNEEGIEDIRYHAPLSIRTLNRAVTFQDYKDITELVPGVGKAAVNLNQVSKSISVYVAPAEGGTASSALLGLVEDELNIKGMIGPVVNALAAGETALRISMEVTAKFRRDTTDTYNDIIEALISSFGFNNSDVNRQVRTSDIIALIDNLDKVDYLSLSELTTRPYPRAIGHSTPIENNIYITVLPGNTSTIRWRIAVSGTNIVVFKSINGGIEALDGEFAIQPSDPSNPYYESSNSEILLGVWGSFTSGLEWQFYTYPYNKDIEFQDYTIPIIDVDELDIVVNKQIIK